MVTRTGIEGLEPSKMTVPKMDRVSVTFALMLDSFVIEPDYPDEDKMRLLCTVCSEALCDIDPGDTMRVLFNTALAHTC